MTTPQTLIAPAGIVRTQGIDDVLERVEQEEDFARDRREWHEGVTLNPGELAYFQTIFTAVLRETNRRLLSHGVVLTACGPNPKGFGAVFMGTDRENRKYDVTMVIPPEVRLAKEALGQEDFVRDLIGMVTDGVLQKRREYLARGGMAK
jgi:hypothetical protein